MGGNQSKTSSTVTNDFLTQITSTFMSQNSQKVTASDYNINQANFSQATITDCNVNITQSIDMSAVATGHMTVQNQQQLTTALQNAMQQKIQQAATQHNGFLAPAFANSAQATSDVINRSNTVIATTISSSTVQNIFATANNTNEADFSHLVYTCSPSNPKTLTLDQTIKAQIVAQGVSDAITTAMQNDSVLNSAITDLSQSASQTNAGLDDLVKAITSFWGIIGMLICVLLCAAVIFVPMLLKPSGGGGGGGGGGNNGGNGISASNLKALLGKA